MADRTRHRAAAHEQNGSLGGAYWRLWASSGLSNVADGIVKVAMPLVAVRYTQSPTLIAGLAFALSLPWLLFALPAGAFADRWDRRNTMLWANGARAAALGALGIVMVLDAGSIWALYLIAFVVGIAETLYDTSAQSFLPAVVHRDQLSRANGRLYAAELTANQFIGPPVGGVLVVVGAGLAFLTPVALWVLAIGALVLVRGSFRIDRPERATLRADIAEGLRFLWRSKVLRILAIATGMTNMAANAAGAVLVLYLVGPESPGGLTDPQYGLLMTATAVGGLLGSVVADGVERRLGRSRSLAVSVIGSVVFVAAPAVTANAWVIGVAFFVGGVTVVVWNVIAVSLRQRITPDRLLGRVNSGYRLVAWGTIPLGALLGGLLATLFGLRAVFALMGAAILALLLLLRLLSDDALDAAERAAATGPPRGGSANRA
jgi:MFS family permease